jgi:hypothetical protein
MTFSEPLLEHQEKCCSENRSKGNWERGPDGCRAGNHTSALEKNKTGLSWAEYGDKTDIDGTYRSESQATEQRRQARLAIRREGVKLKRAFDKL